jgi:two-component system, NtrC family, nitrogen regulation sensor histidine kinase NtrY
MTKSFHLNIAIRITIIAFLCIYTGWTLNGGQPIYNSIAMLLVILILIINLVWYSNKINKKIAYFFDSVSNDDFSLSLPEYPGDKLLNRLSTNLKRISNQIESIHIENQRQEKYFEAMIEHISVGIMSVNCQGFIINCNSSLKKLLGLNQLTHIRQFEKVDLKLAKLVNNIETNQEKTTTINCKNGQVTLLIKASSFKSNNEQLKLISMQDIRKELDEKELDSWLKLIRVLTHEIMNSIAPVTSLSENLCNQFVNDGKPISSSEINEGLISRTIQGLRVIREQGQGLTRFVENYRKLTRLPKPEISEVQVKNLFEKTQMLFKSQYADNKIKISVELENELQTIRVDEGQISQVLLNLLKNAADALAEVPEPMIKLSCRTNSKGETILAVTDNGPGIPPELMDEIFVPFFTTRENGSGIGLSISRQLARLNNGSLKVKSMAHTETTFSLHFG